jgi:hypothetical protein
MEKVNQILINIQSSIQYMLDSVLNLAFQPLYMIIAIIQAIVEIWTASDEEETEQEPQQQVTEYPSANAGRPYPEECDPPVFTHIGFKINQKEKEEIDKIKKELNQ